MDISNYTPNVSLDLPEEAVRGIIQDALKDQLPGFTIKDIYYEVSPSYDIRGDQCGVKFKGVKINFSKV